ncbi:cytochrome c oxidase assembly protein [Actinorugispora endophytica]|uniref:Putative copper resistance protein D n=1 Tax=Actinorugispora endophytica TaxID=1605990 RepID=A0A4V3D8N5_9ACTN|nr:cytochrome c oxidase assembly protein [Actinorugispora endophytica]TDQ52439.1 putative copper resistance protein D [Actinorugispora endophytica]
MASPGTSETQTDNRGTGEAVVLVAAASAASCLIALVLALLLGGAGLAQVIPGLPDPGTLTRWGLPVSKTVMDVSAAVTAGLLVLAVFLLPSDRGALGEQAQSYVRAASWAALVWAVAAAATLVFELSNILGRPATEIIGNEITSYAGSVPQGIGLMVVILVATGVALIGRTASNAAGAAGLVGLTLVGLVPPALTGHASSSPNHELAVTGLALHVLTISLWVGPLAALVFHALRGGEQLPAAVRRFSALALWAWIGVAVSGIASAVSRLYTVEELFTTSYGQIMLAKTAVFLALGGVGWAHRRGAVPRITETAGRALFVRFAVAEVVLMAAAMGLAAALSRTATPPGLATEVDAFRNLTGFAMPPPMSARTLLTLWRPDLFFGLLVVVLGGLYVAGVVRLLRRGDTWPWGRTAAWLAGLLTIAVVQLTGVATYSMVLFSVHMVQHMVLAMLVPVLLVLGAPTTLALRALRPAERRGDRGPREWLNAFLNSGCSRFVTHPGFAAPMFVISTYALYFTPLFGSLMQDHLGHLVMGVHFLLSGFLFYWIMIGVDPAPRKVPYLLRIVLLLLAMGFHAFFGIAIMMQSAPLGMEYYGQFEVPWLDSLADDQYAGGGVAWALGEIPTVLVLVALVVQWARDEERAERRRERHSRRGGSDDADMDDYNAYLASLERGSGGRDRQTR